MFPSFETAMPVDEFNPVNRDHPLTRGRRLWLMTLPHLAAGTKWYDLIGPNVGTLNNFGAMEWGNNGRQGGFGDLGFANGQYVDCGNTDTSLNFTGGNFTVMFFARFTSLASSPVPINRGTYQTNGWYVFISTAGQLYLQCESAGVDNSIATATGAVATGLWHQYALVRTGTSTGGIYRDGLPLSTTGSLGNCASSTSPLQIGQYSGGTDRVSGYMDDIGIWDRALSAAEIAEYYARARQGYVGLVNRWPVRVMEGISILPITPAGIGSAEQWGAPSFSVGAVTISPYGVESSERWGAPIVVPGSAVIAPAAIVSAEQWGQAQIVPGPVYISPAGIGSGEQWGEPVFAPNGVAIFAAGIVSGERWGSPHVGTAHTTIVLLPTSVKLGSDGRTSLDLGNTGKTTVVLQ